MTQDIRFLYLRDSQSDRVVTVARRLSQDRTKVEFAFSVNHPTTRDRYGFTVFRGDTFNKSLGRHIATQRLVQNKGFSANLADGDRSIETVLSFLVDSRNKDIVPQIVRRIAFETIVPPMDHEYPVRMNGSAVTY
jgi:hypothetical protein